MYLCAEIDFFYDLLGRQELVDELFDSVKPGLSSYAENPEKVKSICSYNSCMWKALLGSEVLGGKKECIIIEACCLRD
jgi:hypothetical protein